MKAKIYLLLITFCLLSMNVFCQDMAGNQKFENDYLRWREFATRAFIFFQQPATSNKEQATPTPTWPEASKL